MFDPKDRIRFFGFAAWFPLSLLSCQVKEMIGQQPAGLLL
jgi:hypothetical protein